MLAYQTRLPAEQRFAFMAYATDARSDFPLHARLHDLVDRGGGGGSRGTRGRWLWGLGLRVGW